MLAGASLAAAAIVAVARAARPLDHGVWLVAYLFLVGFLAQFLLGRGQVALLTETGRPMPPRGTRAIQALLWNAGVVLVPTGVLLDARLFIVIGAATLLLALGSFYRSVADALAPPAGAPARLRRTYVALLSLMALSTLVGTALGWDHAWI